jgi:alpha-methylacyl-CoA racemase
MGLVGKSGYVGKPIRPGEGGEEALKAWMGWKKGREYREEGTGALVLTEKSKL